MKAIKTTRNLLIIQIIIYLELFFIVSNFFFNVMNSTHKKYNIINLFNILFVLKGDGLVRHYVATSPFAG